MFSITKKINMKKTYCVICSKYRKFKSSKTSPIFKKTLFPLTICSKCEYKDENILKKNEVRHWVV